MKNFGFLNSRGVRQIFSDESLFSNDWKQDPEKALLIKKAYIFRQTDSYVIMDLDIPYFLE